MTSHEAVELDQHGPIVLAAALREGPETVMAIHHLRPGLVWTVTVGSTERPLAIAVQPYVLPEEPTVHGENTAAIWAALHVLDGWACVNASAAVAPALSRQTEAATDRAVEPIEEVYYHLERPVAASTNPAIRLLGAADAPMVEVVADRLGNLAWLFGSVAVMLGEGIVADAVMEGSIVAAAYTSAIGDRFAEAGVAAPEDRRGRGLAAAAAFPVSAKSSGRAKSRRGTLRSITPPRAGSRTNWGSSRCRAACTSIHGDPSPDTTATPRHPEPVAGSRPVPVPGLRQRTALGSA